MTVAVIKVISVALTELVVVSLVKFPVVLVELPTGTAQSLLFADIEVLVVAAAIDCNVENDGNIGMLCWLPCVLFVS